MRMRLWFVFLFSLPQCLSQTGFSVDEAAETKVHEAAIDIPDSEQPREWENALLTDAEKKGHRVSYYPNFTDNWHISKRMQRLMAPYLLPQTHLIKPILDSIFAENRAIQTTKTLRRAGFSILFAQKKSFIIVAQHPKVHGYLFKIYLDSKRIYKDEMVGWELLTTRCIVAKKIKQLIRDKRLKNFIVADKWLYPLPPQKNQHSHCKPVILVVKDMNIFNRSQSRHAWKTKAEKKHLRELYEILGRGYGSAYLPGNIPYTKTGKFAFIDTEYNKRKIPLGHARRFLNPTMQFYWDNLIGKSHSAHGIYLSGQ
jgi:hypothetical protein